MRRSPRCWRATARIIPAAPTPRSRLAALPADAVRIDQRHARTATIAARSSRESEHAAEEPQERDEARTCAPRWRTAPLCEFMRGSRRRWPIRSASNRSPS
jgi:hypothetical protein